MKNITVKSKISLQTISYLLVSAFEGGSNYWYSDLKFNKDKAPNVEKLKKDGIEFYEDCRHSYWALGGEMEVQEDETGDYHVLNLETIKKGLEVMADKYDWHFADILEETDDATTGDVFLQCCLFGELVYG